MAKWESVPDETPIDDFSGLIPKHVHTRRELSVVEAENINKAITKYLAAKPTRRQAPFDLQWVYKLHREMFGEVWMWAGTRRQSNLNLGIEHYQIDQTLQVLLDDLHYWHDNNAMPVSEQAVRLHHRAVHIHPFQNGNGRWSRTLANIWLRQHREPLIVWPEQTIGQTSVIREDYIKAIKSADGDDYSLLIKLHERYSSP